VSEVRGDLRRCDGRFCHMPRGLLILTDGIGAFDLSHRVTCCE